MQNKKTFITIFVVIVILILGWQLVAYRQKYTNPIQAPTTIEESSASSPTQTRPVTLEETSTINSAWDVLQTYIKAAKEHDLKTVTELSYQISDECKDVKLVDKCNTRMDSAYAFGREMKKADYTNAWIDNKQIILFTKENFVATTTVRGAYKGFIYFTRDTSGNIKFLSFNPEVGAYVLTKDKTNEQVDAEIQAMIKDSDEDGLADYIETCRENALSTCLKTDPNKRDSNNNGWWDGIENLFYIKH